VLSGKTVALESSPNGTSWSAPAGPQPPAVRAPTPSRTLFLRRAPTIVRCSQGRNDQERRQSDSRSRFQAVAVADSYEAAEDTPLVVSAAGVLANDSDADGDPLTAVKVANASTARSHLAPTARSPTRLLRTTTAPTRSLYRAYDGKAYSNTVTVSITVTAVNDAPVAGRIRSGP